MIHLVHPDGHREKLRWTDQHPRSAFGLGALSRGRTGQILDGETFAELVARGGRLECSNDLERRRAAGALGWTALGVPPDALRLVAPSPEGAQHGT